MTAFVVLVSVSGAVALVLLLVVLRDMWAMWREKVRANAGEGAFYDRVSEAWRADQIRSRRGFDDNDAA